VTATPRRKGYRSTVYDNSPRVKAEKPAAGVAAAARGQTAASHEDEWPISGRLLKAGTASGSQSQACLQTHHSGCPIGWASTAKEVTKPNNGLDVLWKLTSVERTSTHAKHCCNAGKRPLAQMQKDARAKARNKQQQEGLANIQRKVGIWLAYRLPLHLVLTAEHP
jgi:hypothetical protein